jgi:hypothetical protein
MRYNKDFIAEMLAETIQGANEETRRQVNIRDVGTGSGLESMPTHNFRETSRGQAAAKHLRDQNQVTPSIIASAIMYLILLFIFPAATLAQTSLLTAGSRAQNASPAILLMVAASRPASTIDASEFGNHQSLSERESA